MADEFFTKTQASAPAARRGGGKALVLTAIAALLIGGGAVGYASWAGLFPFDQQAPDRYLAAQSGLPKPLAGPAPAASPSADPLASAPVQQGAMETRLAALEQKLAQLDLRAAAASGNAARAEGLLIAFAARRALDRGVPLGYLEDQLRLRFADAQPNAVQTVIDASRQPMTLVQLTSSLDAMSPDLTGAPAKSNAWDKMKFEFSNLFVIRHDTAPSAVPANRLDRARLLLEAGKVDEAVAEVQRLPGAAGANDWINAARRYGTARQALDLIETTALLDTRALKDNKGDRVDQPGPANAPAPVEMPGVI